MIPTPLPRRSAARSRTAACGSGRRWRSAFVVAGVRVRAPPGVARAGASRRRPRARRRRLHEGEPALLSQQGARRASARLRRHRQHGAERPRSARTTRSSRATGTRARPDRRARPRVQPRSSVRRPAGATLELTIDQYLQHVVERELRAGVEENRAAGGTAVVMDPSDRRNSGARELAHLQSERLPRCASGGPAQSRGAGSLRARLDIQDRHGVGGLRGERASNPTTGSMSAPAQIRFGVGVISDTHRYGVLSFADVIVKSSNVGAIKVGLKLGPERLGRTRPGFGFGRPQFARISRVRARGIVWNPAKLNDSALASRIDGLSGRRDAAADGRGRQLDRQWRRADRAAHRPRRHPGRHAHTRAAQGRAPDGDAEHGRAADRHHGAGRRARHRERWPRSRASRSPARRARRRKWSTAATRDPTTTRRSSASCRRASRSLTIVVVIDSPHGKNSYFGGPVAAPIFKRIADAALRHRGVPPIDQSAAAGAG